MLSERRNHPLRISQIAPADVPQREDRKPIRLCREDLPGKVNCGDSGIDRGERLGRRLGILVER
jgi:hypothetical protein